MRVLWAAIPLLGVLLASLWLQQSYFKSGQVNTVFDGLTFTGKLVSINILVNKIDIEEEIPMEFIVDEKYTLSHIWVEGMNMYMGRTPVLIDSNNNKVGVMFLGSCSEPQMQWRINVELVNENGDKELEQFSFVTVQY